MKRNAGRYLPPQRARRRPANHHGAAVAALDDDAYRFVFENFGQVPVVVHTDELWRIVDLRFLRHFGTPFPDRLAAVVADNRVCVAAAPWWGGDHETARIEHNGYGGTIASRKWGGALLVETRLPRFRSSLAEKHPHVLRWMERIVRATVDGRVR